MTKFSSSSASRLGLFAVGSPSSKPSDSITSDVWPAGSKYKMRCNLKWYICCKASTTKIYLLTTTGVLPTHYGEGVLVGRTIII